MRIVMVEKNVHIGEHQIEKDTTDDTVSQLKNKIQDVSGVPANDQSLISLGRSLLNEMKLLDYNIQEQDTLYCINIRPIIKISILLQTGKTVIITVKSKGSVYELKEVIQQIEGIPIDKQRFFLADGTILDDDRMVDSNITDINLVIRE